MHPDRRFDELAESYDRREELQGDPLAPWLCANLPGSGGAAVDLACGAGRHAAIVAERFDRVLAVDLSRDMIDLARRRRPVANVTYRQGDLHAIGGAFDLVFCASALHDVDDLDRALRHVRSLVAPGGMAILADVVSRLPVRPAWWWHARAAAQLAIDLARGRPGARERYRLSTEPAWVAHLASDRVLSRKRLQRAYARHFPGATFARAGHLHVCQWRDGGVSAPRPGPGARAGA